jgi:hypothetical protein
MSNNGMQADGAYTPLLMPNVESCEDMMKGSGFIAN